MSTIPNQRLSYTAQFVPPLVSVPLILALSFPSDECNNGCASQCGQALSPDNQPVPPPRIICLLRPDRICATTAFATVSGSMSWREKRVSHIVS